MNLEVLNAFQWPFTQNDLIEEYIKRMYHFDNLISTGSNPLDIIQPHDHSSTSILSIEKAKVIETLRISQPHYLARCSP